MKIAFQITYAIFSILGGLQKHKWAMMLTYTLSNIVCVCMYFIFGRVATACLCIIATLRMIVFFIFSLKKLKPNIFILIFFELSFVISTIFTWQDATDLLPLFALLVSCFASWQDNTLIIRIGFVINPALYIIYDVIMGAYIAITPEIVMLISNIVAIIYYNIFKQERPILSYFYKRKHSENDEEKELTKEPQTVSDDMINCEENAEKNIVDI